MYCEKRNSCFNNSCRDFVPTNMCDPSRPFITQNRVKDYRTLENQQDPGQVSLRQNINSKHVRIENNSKNDVLVGIDIHRNPHNQPKPKFLLRGGEVRDLAVNMPGEILQYIWLYDSRTGKILNDPHAMQNHMNQFVVIEGTNRWWIMDFQHKGYRAQF